MKKYPAIHFNISSIPPNSILEFQYNDYETEGTVTGYLYVDECSVPQFVNEGFMCDKNISYLKPINNAYNVPNNTVTNEYNADTNELEYVVCEFNVYLSVCRYHAHINKKFNVCAVKTANAGYITVNDVPTPIITNYYNKFSDFLSLRVYLNELRTDAGIFFLEAAHKAQRLKIK